MDSKERKRWQILAIIGTIFTFVCLIVSIFQYFIINSHYQLIFRKYVAMSINAIAFLGFVCLIFTPIDFWVYSIIFYVYGVGNFFDSGNMLGALCIFVSMLFLNRLGFFQKHKPLKIALLSILPTAGLVSQIFSINLVSFVISVFHIFAIGFILIILFIYFYPQLSSIQNVHSQISLSPEICTEEEIEWLSLLAKGEKYIGLSKRFNISESKVKQRILELYKILGVHNKTEFLTLYHGCKFELKNTPTH